MESGVLWCRGSLVYLKAFLLVISLLFLVVRMAAGLVGRGFQETDDYRFRYSRLHILDCTTTHSGIGDYGFRYSRLQIPAVIHRTTKLAGVASRLQIPVCLRALATTDSGMAGNAHDYRFRYG